jgi:hypothetical protein
MSTRHEVIINMITELNNCSVGIEVGVACGQLSEVILNNTNLNKLYCIDPWKVFPKDFYIDAMNDKNTQNDWDNCYQSVVNNLKGKFNNRVSVLRGISEDFINNFEDNSLDFVYIDGNHNYHAVLNDIELWYPKIKTNGILIGDDACDDGYHIWSYKEDGSPNWYGEYGVKRALETYTKKNELNYEILPYGQWRIRK